MGAQNHFKRGHFKHHDSNSKSFEEAPKETVFIVHGFLGSPFEFALMKRRLQDLGYSVHLWGHTTIFRSVDSYSNEFCKFVIKKMSRTRMGRIHFLGHSMGAIIVRSALEKLSPRIPMWQRGRAVLLAPPNKGSYAARLVPSWLKNLVPSIADLSDDAESYVNGLSDDFPIPTGVVWTKYDHLVPPKSVFVKGISDSVEITDLHTTMVFRKSVVKLADNFFKKANFGLKPKELSS